MHLKEGYRRIGVATYLVAIMLGIVAFSAAGNLVFATFVGLAVILLFHIGVYVAKGFMKQSDKEKDKD